MPKTAVQLHVWLRGFSLFEKEKRGSRSEEEADIKQALRKFDFSILETWEPVDGREIHTYPFEYRDANIQKINELVNHLRRNYTDCDIEASSDPTSLGKQGRDLPAEKFMMITVDARTQSDEL